MKKHLFLKSLLIAIGLLIASINTAWAASVTSDGTIRLYFNVEAVDYWNDGGAKLYAYFYNCDASSDCATSTWSSEAKCSFGDVYYILIPSGTWKGVILTRHNPNKKSDGTDGTFDEPSWNNKWNQTSDITLDGTKTYIASFSNGSSTVTWETEPPMPYLKGSFDTWGDGYRMLDGTVTLTLAASATFNFKIYYSGDWYGKSSGSITNTTTSWLNLDSKNGSNDNVSFTAGEAGEYIFKFSKDGYVGVYYPQARLKKNKVIYFDARNSDASHWNSADFASRFYFKYYDSGVDQSNVMVVADDTTQHSVYPVTVPNDDFIGRVQINRYSADGKTDWTDATAVCYSLYRTSSAENCMYIKAEQAYWANNQTLDWTTYCPPMSDVNLEENGTTLNWGGSGTSGSPYLIPTGASIKVIATNAASVVDDDNMTIYYQFKKAGTEVQAGSTTASATITASGSTGTKEAVTVEAYNYYNSTSGTHLASNEIYYEVRTPYTISYNKGTYGTGSRDSETKLKGVNFTLPNSAVFTRDHYTQTGWTTSDLGAQTHSLGGTYSSDVAQEFFPAWTEDEYTVTTSSGTGGSVDEDSYSAYVATTTAISATPAAGYKFHSWEVVSGDVTFADQYSASTTMNATSDAEIKANFVYRWSIAGTWKYYPDTDTEDADAYTMGNIGRNASSKDTCYVEITLAANSNYTFQVVDRSTSPYTWHKNSDDESAPFYMTYGNSTAWTFSSSYTKACGITTAGAGTYKFAYNISDGQVTVTYPNSYTVTFGYGTGGSAVTASVEDAGSINSGDYATAGKDITFTKTAANLAYTFKGWYNASSDGDAISCMASDDVYDDIAANISVYAQFKTRYGLHGSLMDDVAGGMPGWAGDGADFTVVSFTALGEGTGKGVDLECSRTLEPNKEYKFRVQDRAAGSRWGLSSSAVLPAEAPGNNVKLNVYGDESGKDVKIETVGYGTYVFHITNMYDSGDGKYYPAIQVDRPASSQLTLGWKHYTNGTLSDGNTGGTVTAATNEGSGFDIANGQFYANGSDLAFTAAPATGYHVEGWYSDASCSSAYTNGEGGATISGVGNVTLILSSVSTNKTVYVKFAEDENTLTTAGNWNTAGNWSAGHVPTINEVVYLPKAVTVDIAGAKAKRVRIQRDGETYTGKLTISATGGLVVAEDIKAQHEEDGAYEATTKEDLRIETSYEGNGGLITGNACEGNNAEYEFYTKAYKYSYDTYKFYINQYIGIPFVSMEAYKLYGFNIFVYDDGADDWRTPGSATMEAWKAYDLIRRYENDDWSYFNLDGELNLPGKSATKTFTCSWRGTDGSIDNTAGHEDYLFANSWTAPISIKDITASNCSGTSGADLVQTIYIFNAGYEGAGQKSVGEYAGQWSSFPLASSSYMANAVIPATQAFMVTSKKGSTGATLTLSYNDHVYTPAIDANQINTYPTRAPRRTQANDDPNVLRIIVRSSDVDADQLYVFERGDFTFNFDDSWDGNKILGESFAPQLYALSGSNKMAVNAVPDMEGMKIGFKAGKYDNQYTFSFEYADDAETLYLYDTDTQEYTQISSEATYSFTTSDTKEHERFVITRSKAPQIVTGVDGVVSASDARKQMINGTLYIIRDGRMYNAEGALVK